MDNFAVIGILLAVAIGGTFGWVLARRAAASEVQAAKDETVIVRERAEVEIKAAKEDATLARDRAEADLVLKTAAETKLAAAQEGTSETIARLTHDLNEAYSERNQARIAREEAEKKAALAKQEVEAMNQRMADWEKAKEEKVALLNDAKERLTLEVQVLADKIFSDHSSKFTQQNKEQVGNLLDPLHERIKEFRLTLETAHTESKVERTLLSDQIRNLTSTSTAMMAETSNLTKALKGDAQIQGAWGEMKLESLLERSGLKEGEEYFAQSSYIDSDGRRVKPDFVVNLPNDRRIVVDSKVSLTAYERCSSANDEAERAGHLKANVSSIRSHIRILAEKNYHVAADSRLDYVIMFVAIEGALAAALQCDPELTTFAIDQGVQLATPTTLMIALRTIANVWQVERRNRNAEEIANRAGKLYDKFVGFVADMEVLGGRLDQAKASYDDALKKLSSGQGNIVRQVEQLKSMGAKTNKALPSGVLNDAQDLLDIALGDAIETSKLPEPVR